MHSFSVRTFNACHLWFCAEEGTGYLRSEDLPPTFLPGDNDGMEYVIGDTESSKEIGFPLQHKILRHLKKNPIRCVNVGGQWRVEIY